MLQCTLKYVLKVLGSDFCNAYDFVNFYPFKLNFPHIIDIDKDFNMTYLKMINNCGQKTENQILFFD